MGINPLSFFRNLCSLDDDKLPDRHLRTHIADEKKKNIEFREIIKKINFSYFNQEGPLAYCSSRIDFIFNSLVEVDHENDIISETCKSSKPGLSDHECEEVI